MHEVIHCKDLLDLSRQVVELFVLLADQAIMQRGRFFVALSGGSTPHSSYVLLSDEPHCERVRWRNVHFFWGDERCVPSDHPESNFRMANEALLQKISVPAENIHRIPTELKDPELVAAEYEKRIRNIFQQEWPCFDLILLGMGEDGHTASLFPHTTALKETKRLVVANFVEKISAHRITFSAPLINHAANVVFLVSGRSKASALKEVLGGPNRPLLYPAQLIRPLAGRLRFYVDREAGSE